MRTNIVPAVSPYSELMAKVERMNYAPTFVEDAVVLTEEMEEEGNTHPNFIESNTSGITLGELVENPQRCDPVRQTGLTLPAILPLPTYAKIRITPVKLMV